MYARLVNIFLRFSPRISEAFVSEFLENQRENERQMAVDSNNLTECKHVFFKFPK